MHAAFRQGLDRLSLTKPVTKAVWRNDVEHLARDPVVLFDVEFREFLVEPVGIEFCEQCLKVLHMEGTAVLGGIATVFRKSNLDVVARQNAELCGVSLRDSTRKPSTVS
jgi:hypothetical protein